MNILQRFWKWQCSLTLAERGLWLLGGAVFTFLLGLILASGEWSSGSGLIYNLGHADLEIIDGDWEIPLKYWTAFSLLIGTVGLGMFLAGRRGRQ
jgi:hypothetical protein